MNTPEEFLYIVNLSNATDIDVENGVSEPSWEDFRDSLMTHRIRKFKNGEAFLPVMMKPEHEWQLLKSKKGEIEHYRFDVNIEAITALVIDIDKPGALEVAEQLFEGYEYVVHSTHNFTPETPWKYRLIARLQEPIMVEDWQQCFEALKSRIDLDTSCRNPSRCYYYPSHSVDSHISPRAFYRTGRAMTRDNILEMGTELSRESMSPMKFRTMGTLPIAAARAKRHFSGKIVGHYDRLPQVLSNSREDYEERHKKSIEGYMADDSRHNLALSITSREYYMLGPKADLRATLVFLYQVAAEGGRPLETGNTVDELPDMVISAMQKYAPEAYEDMLENYGDKSMSWIVDQIDWAQRNYESLPQKKITVTNNTDEDNYRFFRSRHQEFLRDYVATGDFKALVSKIIEKELDSDKPAYSDIAKAILAYCKGYEANVAKTPAENISQAVTHQSRAVCDDIGKKGGTAESADYKKATYMRSAILVEVARLGKKERVADNSPGL